MAGYTRSEKIDMILIFGECKQNSAQAAELYAQRYPDRRHPTRHYFPKLVEKLRQEPEANQNATFIVSEEKEIQVLACIELNMTVSLREIALECQISKNSAWRILQKHNYRSFKYQLHQHLHQEDNMRRLQYCNWYLERYFQDNTFPFKILYTDESRFTNLGVFNRNNKRYWAQENRHLMQVGNFQERFGFNCWVGIIGDRILGPIIFDGHLTGERYLQFLTHEIQELLDEIPINRYPIFYQQDGAPPHNTRAVINYLNTTYGDNWIGNAGPILWPARSPDLTPLDFFLWGTIKNEVYNTTSATRLELENKVRAVINRITPEQLREVVRATIQKVQCCIEQDGGHFEHLNH